MIEIILAAENDVKKKSALRSKVNEYITRAENLKQFVYLNGKNSESNATDKKCFNNITRGAVFRELSKY